MRILSVFLLVICSASSALAQDGGNLRLNIFQPAVDSRGYLSVNASQTLGHKELSFGIMTSWANTILEFESGPNKYEITNIVTPVLVGAYGLKLGIDLEIGVSIPFNIVFGDRGPDDFGMPGPNDDEKFAIDGQGLGNIGLHLKARFLNTSKSAVGLGVVLSAYLPTQSASETFSDDDGLTLQGMAILDKEFGRRFRASLNGGIRYRTGDTRFVDNTSTGMPANPITNGVIDATMTAPFGLGLSFAITPQKFEVVGELFGEVPLDAENFFPVEAAIGLKAYLARNSFFTIAGGAGLLRDEGATPDWRGIIGIVYEPSIGDRDGDGIKDDVDQCPDDPEDKDGFEDLDGCPDPDNDRDGILDEDDECPNVPEDKDGDRDEDGCPDGDIGDRDGDGIPDEEDQCPDDPEDIDGFEDKNGCPDNDNDQDGILDVDDLCPDDPEDKDGFKDEDGCPDPDNDRDRILDVDDKCPNKPETYNGKDDEDGCPDKGLTVVTDTGIMILKKVYFDTAKTTLQSRSFPILDAVAATLQGNPDIQLIEIQGHTDERGNDDYNLKLSDGRAHTVKKYLIDKGIDGSRLRAQGYGENDPIDRRKTKAAYEKNRRVEFLILKRSAQLE